jgi:hypothetical protein
MLDSFALDIPLGEPESPVPRVVTRSDQIRLNPIKAKQSKQEDVLLSTFEF